MEFSHLEVFNTEFATKEFMLLPHVLLQICKGVEWLQVWTQRAFMLQQLPGGQESISEVISFSLTNQML